VVAAVVDFSLECVHVILVDRKVVHQADLPVVHLVAVTPLRMPAVVVEAWAAAAAVRLAWGHCVGWLLRFAPAKRLEERAVLPVGLQAVRLVALPTLATQVGLQAVRLVALPTQVDLQAVSPTLPMAVIQNP
jgi:hypothetical protein